MCLQRLRVLSFQDHQNALVAWLRGEIARVFVSISHPAELQVCAVPGVDCQVGFAVFLSIDVAEQERRAIRKGGESAAQSSVADGQRCLSAFSTSCRNSGGTGNAP